MYWHASGIRFGILSENWIMPTHRVYRKPVPPPKNKWMYYVIAGSFALSVLIQIIIQLTH